MHAHSLNCSAFWTPPTSQRWHSPSQTCPFSRKELSVTSFLCCILICISHIYGIRLIVIIVLSSRLSTLSQREELGRRASDGAAVKQPSNRGALSFQRLKCGRVTTKTERSHFCQLSPCSLSSFHSLHWNIQYNHVASLSVSLLLRLQYLSLFLSGSIRRLIRLSWPFLDALCWWCSSTGEAGGWVAAIITW